MNAAKATDARIRENSLFKAFRAAMGIAESGETAELAYRFERIVLLFDPDADGIHSGALMLIYMLRTVPDLLKTGNILTVRAPLFRVTSPDLEEPMYAASQFQIEKMREDLTNRGITDLQTIRYRGLGSLEESLLRTQCIDPKTRRADVMTKRDARMAMQVFGGELD